MLRNHFAGCTSRRGTPLRAFDNEFSAEEGARHALVAHGSRMLPYRCERCGRWHLCDAARHTPSHRCVPCSKESYETRECAERRAAILLDERGVRLRVYACPVGDGWHLTKRM